MRSDIVVTALLAASANAQLQGLNDSNYGLLVKGLLEGALDSVDLNDYITCTYEDSSIVIDDVEAALADFETKSL